MSFISEVIRPLSGDVLDSVTGGVTLPIPPIHGGPVHTPVLPAFRVPIGEPLPKPGNGPLL